MEIAKDDVHRQLKAKVRLVRLLDTDKSHLVEEFTLICEVLATEMCGDSLWLSSRLVSLWFGEFGKTNQIFLKYKRSLAKSTSLLNFFYQIVGRIGTFDISKFVIECAINHPFVCVPAILQLRSQTTPTGKQAEYILEKLRQNLSIQKIVAGLVGGFKFYLALAMAKPPPVAASASRGHSLERISGYSEYTKIVSAGHACVLTCTNSSLGVSSIASTYTVADSGKSLPKIVQLTDTEGRVHRQIVKGNDDLRNDAILQQLFNILGVVRSYVVVPISAHAGIAEWVTGTVTMGNYLAGVDEQFGAHHRYFPTDILPSEFKARMVKARQQKESLVSIFSSQNFQPVLHFFFYENWSSAETFFEAQSRYANSVAVTSVVGFVTGLGDRHPNNILLDTVSGQVVHIDYGICFESGKFLKVPEIVPFRLTPDVVDGLGSLGVHGPFTRLCIDAMDSLKAKSALVTAIVEVCVVDPMFNWAVASLGSDNAVNALNAVVRKLQGFVNNESLPLSTNAQIDRLIRTATDPQNLALMFAGWQPWL